MDSLYRKTWIDVQTRAVFIEFTVLNAPSTFVVSGVLMLEYGAEGDVLPSAHYTVSSLYKSYLILATALQMFFADATSTYFFYLFAVLGAYVVLVLCNPWGRNMPKWAGGLSTRERKRRDAQEKRKREAAEKRGETSWTRRPPPRLGSLVFDRIRLAIGYPPWPSTTPSPSARPRAIPVAGAGGHGVRRSSFR